MRKITKMSEQQLAWAIEIYYANVAKNPEKYSDERYPTGAESAKEAAKETFKIVQDCPFK
jgi:hypothetical protein